MRKGSKASLSGDDLFPLLDEEKSQILTEKLERAWLQEVARCRLNGQSPRLWRCLSRLVSWKGYLIVAVLKMLQTAAYTLLPVMLWFFLQSLASASEISHDSPAVLWLMGICLASTVLALSMTHFIYASFVWGVRWKVATIGLIYKRVSSGISVLRMTPLHSQVQKGHSPNLPKEKCMGEVVRIGSKIIFHVSEL